MTTIAQILGMRSPALDRDSDDIVLNCGIGIEVELEEVPYLEIPGWDCKEDGSLRNGREFVCSRPFSGIKLKKVITDFASAMGRIDVNGSWRCSTHVHMDMRGTNTMTLKKTILAFIFYEKVMYACSGMHRYKSNFAPAMAAVQDQLVTLADLWHLNDEMFVRHLASRWDKYSSLNMKPLTQFGSIELRISEPKWNRDNLMYLVNRFLMLKKLASDSPETEDYADFVNKLWELGIAPMRPYLVSDYEHNEDYLTEGYVNAHDVLAMRDGAVVVDSITSQEPPTEAELTDESWVRIPNRGHWSNIRNYIRSGNDSSNERNERYRGTDVPYSVIRECVDLMRYPMDNDGSIQYGNFNRCLEIWAMASDSALRNCAREVREAFERNDEETDF